MEAAMQLLGGDHVAELAVLVGLAGLEGLGVGHGDRRLEAGSEARKIAQVSGGGNGDFAAQFLGVGGHRAEDHQPAGGMTGALEIVEQEVNQQEMAEVVGGHRDLVALGGALGVLEPRQVDRRVHHQGIQGPTGGMESIHQQADALEIAQIHLQMSHPVSGDGEGRLGPASLVGVAAGHHHMPAAVHQGLGGKQADPRGGPGDQHRAGGAAGP